MEAYCLKCRQKREMQDPVPVTMKNGKSATQGICPVCGTKMYKIGKATPAAATTAAVPANPTTPSTPTNPPPGGQQPSL